MEKEEMQKSRTADSDWSARFLRVFSILLMVSGFFILIAYFFDVLPQDQWVSIFIGVCLLFFGFFTFYQFQKTRRIALLKEADLDELITVIGRNFEQSKRLEQSFKNVQINLEAHTEESDSTLKKAIRELFSFVDNTRKITEEVILKRDKLLNEIMGNYREVNLSLNSELNQQIRTVQKERRQLFEGLFDVCEHLREKSSREEKAQTRLQSIIDQLSQKVNSKHLPSQIPQLKRLLEQAKQLNLEETHLRNGKEEVLEKIIKILNYKDIHLLIPQPKEPFKDAFHQIQDKEYTDNRSLEDTIAEVYSLGLVYKEEKRLAMVKTYSYRARANDARSTLVS